MRRGSNWPLLALGALLFFRRGATGTPVATATAPGEAAKVQTGGQSPAAWFAERFALALEALRGNVPADKLRDIALSVVAQWAHESARGKNEFNFNLGGWHARKRDVYFVSAGMGDPATTRWTAYPSLPVAVADQLQRLHDVFPSAWRLLTSDPLSSAWVEELGRRGYYTGDRGAYARAWAMHRAELGQLTRAAA